MITFLKIPPEEIEYLPSQVIEYLEDAIKRTPASTARLDVTLEMAKKGYGNIYLIGNDGLLTGAAYILVYDTFEGKIVAPVLVGGHDMWHWREHFYSFIEDFSQKIDAHKVRWIGRKGWLRTYPKARVIGYIFEHDIDKLVGSCSSDLIH